MFRQEAREGNTVKGQYRVSFLQFNLYNVLGI